MADGGYFIQIAGHEHGPYSDGDLHDFVRKGSLKSATLVKRADGSSKWIPASEIPGMFVGRDWGTALLLSIFLGMFGADRFYLGYTNLGIFKFFTCGGCFIWMIIDIFLIATGRLNDVDGRPLKR